MVRLLQRYGIDVRQLLMLLGVYLKQDLRGGKTFMQSSAKEYVGSNWALLLVVATYALFGMLVGLIAFSGFVDVFLFSVIVLSFTFFVAALAIVAESGNVIFNEHEVDIMGHLPVSPRTYFAAKMLNLLAFASILAIAANLFPTLTGIWAPGSNKAFPLGHAVSSILVSLFATSLVVACYGLLMRYVSRERFDNLIAYAQVALVLIFSFGWQLMPRIFDVSGLGALEPGFRWYYLLYPPAWFSGVSMVVIGKIEAGTVALASAAILSLICLCLIALRKLSTGYTSFVSSLAYGSAGSLSLPGSEKNERVESSPRRETGLVKAIGRIFLSRPAERAVFDLVSYYFRRNREIKVRLYPSLPYIIFFPVLALLTEGFPDPVATGGGSFYALMGAAMISFVALTAVEVLRFSDHFNAAYIFIIAPIPTLGDIHRGFRKAVLFYIAAPGFALLLLLYAILWGNILHALLVLLPWMVLAPVVVMIPFVFRQSLPLSRKYQKGQQSARNMVSFFLSVGGLSIIGGLQSLSFKGYFPYWTFIVAIASASLLIHLLIKKISGEAERISNLKFET